MERDIVDIITEKEFIELTAQEREEVLEYCGGEDEFNQMKEVFIGVNASSFNNVHPSAETKKSLDDLFDKTYPKAAPIWYMSVLAAVAPKDKSLIQQPLLKVAAIALLFVLIVPFFNDSVVNEKEQLAQVDNVEDSKIDDSELEGQFAPNEANNSVVQPNTGSDDELFVADEESPSTVNSEIDLEGRTRGGVTDANFGADMAPGSTISSFAFTNAAAEPGFDHPDGIFDVSTVAATSGKVSVSAADTPDVLDLLTATF